MPRGCAVFYVPQKNHHLIRSTLPTSHGFVPLPREGAAQTPDPLANSKLIDSPFRKLFRFVATTDDSAYLCIIAALKFRKEICGGEDSIQAYNTHIAVEGGRTMTAILGTEVMEETGDLRRCFFANVRLPLTLGDENNGEKSDIAKDDALHVANWIVEKLVDEFDMYFGIYIHAGSIWARLSGQIYIDLEDVERGAKALRDLCARVKAGEHQPDREAAA